MNKYFLQINITFLLLLSHSVSVGQPSSDALEIGQYARAYNSSTPNVFGGDFSVETWVYLKDESCANASGAGNSNQPGHNSNDVFVSVGDHKQTNAGSFGGFELGIQSSDGNQINSSCTTCRDKFYFTVGDGGSSPAIVYSSFTNTNWKNTANGYTSSNNTGIPKCQTWYHVAGVYDHSASQIKLYVNGEFQGSASTSNCPPTSSPNSGIALGSEATNSGSNSGTKGTASGFLTGSLDNVAIWNTDKSSTYGGSSSGTYTTNYQRTISSSASGLVTYYDFDQTNQTGSNQNQSGSSVEDDKGSLDLTLYDTHGGSSTKYNCGRDGNNFQNTCRNSSNGYMSYSPNASLPVSLINFTAKKLSNGAVHLTWSTAQEVNNSHFTVQKSMDAAHWEIVEDIRGAGNASSINHYETIDNNPWPGISYYRLKQNDFDGGFAYFPIQSVGEESLAFQVEISPNPAENNLRIDGALKANQSITIWDNQGLDLSHLIEVIEQGEQHSLLDVSKLKSGMYFLNTGHQILKFSKK